MLPCCNIELCPRYHVIALVHSSNSGALFTIPPAFASRWHCQVLHRATTWLMTTSAWGTTFHHVVPSSTTFPRPAIHEVSALIGMLCTIRQCAVDLYQCTHMLHTGYKSMLECRVAKATVRQLVEALFECPAVRIWRP